MALPSGSLRGGRAPGGSRAAAQADGRCGVGHQQLPEPRLTRARGSTPVDGGNLDDRHALSLCVIQQPEEILAISDEDLVQWQPKELGLSHREIAAEVVLD